MHPNQEWSIGAARHVADIKTGDMDRQGMGIHWITGWFKTKVASQSGMSMGGSRHAADIRVDDMDAGGMGIIGLQAGSNKGASQSGNVHGWGVDMLPIFVLTIWMLVEMGIIGLQAGSNKGASQSGMSMGGSRHAADIRADDMDAGGMGIIGLQAGSNKGASQSGMVYGWKPTCCRYSRRSDGCTRTKYHWVTSWFQQRCHLSRVCLWADPAVVDPKMSTGDQSTIGLQAGSNKGASQSGMSMGGARHVSDIKVSQMDKSGQGVINLQYGSNQGGQSTARHGVGMGGRRNINK